MSTKLPMEQETGPKDLPHAPAAPAVSEAILATLERKFIKFLETGEVPDGLFADDIFLDFTPPLWRLQASGMQDALAFVAQAIRPPARCPDGGQIAPTGVLSLNSRKSGVMRARSGIAVKWRGRTSSTVSSRRCPSIAPVTGTQHGRPGMPGRRCWCDPRNSAEAVPSRR